MWKNSQLSQSQKHVGSAASIRFKPLRFQTGSIYDALVEVSSETANDPKSRTEAASLARQNEEYPFLVSLLIWHDLLEKINIVSKMLQTKDMQFDVALQSLENTTEFLKS
ncbi:unnamed protein product [Lymnaea stagnalis]|uniref:Uncharacterized protein n=1 Tax=Lymnaea stagnalis TaxID=6523 RepID=A0AAV2IC06_LYMST